MAVEIQTLSSELSVLDVVFSTVDFTEFSLSGTTIVIGSLDHPSIGSVSFQGQFTGTHAERPEGGTVTGITLLPRTGFEVLARFGLFDDPVDILDLMDQNLGQLIRGLLDEDNTIDGVQPDTYYLFGGNDEFVYNRANFLGTQDIEVFGGVGDDTLSVLPGEERGRVTFYGESGNDTLKGGILADRIFGGGDNDIIEGLEGNDEISGGDGEDVIRGGVGSDEIQGGKDADAIFGDEGRDVIDGGGGGDDIFGGADRDIIDGANGKDTIFGDAGRDRIFGGSGNDKLYGNDDRDTIIGDGGSDKIWGGEDKDTLRGEDGMTSSVVEGHVTNWKAARATIR